MKYVSRFKHTFFAFLTVVFVFMLFQYALAQDVENPEEVLVDDQSSEENINSLPEEDATTPESIEEDISGEVIIEKNIEEGTSLLDRIIDVFVDEDPSEEVSEDVIQTEEQIIQEEIINEKIPFVFTENLPKMPAFPETKDFETDIDAPHACWVEDFAVDMQFLPNKNNRVILNNPTTGPSTLEIAGIPTGFDIFFIKNKSQTISVGSNQQEIEFTIEKVDKTQKGNFNVTFVFTKKMGGESTTTCQMNLINN